MTVTILGVNGFLSTAIAKYCNEKGIHLEMHGIGKPIYNKCDACFQTDLLKGELNYERIIKSNIIIYAIGAGIQSNLKEEADLIYNLNVSIPVKICCKLKELDYKGVFITFGSFFEMGETLENHPFTEKDLINSMAKAPNDYTVSKRMLSRFVSSYQHDYTHWHFFLPTIYGVGENPKRLIPYTINAILNNEELHFTTGDQVRQYIHISEVPSLIELSYQKHLPSGLYNIEGKETLSVKEIVTLIHEILNKEISDDCFGSVDRADVGMKYLALDGNKLYNAIGFKSSKSIVENIKEYCI